MIHKKLGSARHHQHTPSPSTDHDRKITDNLARKEQARNSARTLTSALGGRWFRRYGRATCPACQGGRRGNYPLSIADAPSGALLLYCFRGCAFAEVLDALRGLGLVDGAGTYRPPSREDIARLRAEEEAEAVKRAALAERCWTDAQPIAGTPGEAYLRRRGIEGDLPEALRFLPDCWHPAAKRLPAIVARVDGAERFAIHRTYLRGDGSGKADVEPAKAMLGATRGGAVRLAAGPGPLIVAEGIETALSLPSLLPETGPTWAALSTSGMSALRLPATPDNLIVAVDGEEAGREAGRALAQRATAEGWRVRIADPGDGLDFNDLLHREGAA